MAEPGLADPQPQVSGWPEAAAEPLLEVRELSVFGAKRPILRNISLRIEPHQVFGIIGPSGAGKSTLLRCLNRLIELTPQLRVAGEVWFHGKPVLGAAPADDLRVAIGMIFQQPVVFPKSIYKNVLFGLRKVRRVPRREWPDRVEQVLREVALWHEVEHRLHEPAASLSLGQQQRLCLARTLALQPEVILMDEPTSALDPKSTEAIEELILGLKNRRQTIVLVSHNMRQVRRVADYLACVCLRDGAGEVVESACCDAVFQNPRCHEVVHFLNSFR